MKKTQPVSTLLNNINTTYLTENEKYEAIARAERAEYLVECLSDAVKSVKKTVSKCKALFTSSSAQHV
ncbi:hypothetical protein [Marinomonas algarum]|uniref:Uncharacterized protein n=1 Tax=Marinomonas algarum TaxID=2883105 RepID=A0A9X1IND9_9GAMM|nr:hypothetical protein [Marinomonas algarum]MCB5162453.1 hypothetical protein [Marinomonas algarum]